MPRLIPAYLLAAVVHAVPCFGVGFDAPADYYDTATGTGQVLKDQLHDIIDGHTEFSYNSARSILLDTDVDPNDPDRIVLVYDRTSLDVSGLISSPGIPGWDSGASWNREHTWPRSRGVGSSGADNSDLHQLRPSNPGINGSRSNLNFGGAYGQDFGRVTDNGATVWYPGDADAGMISRQQFYMAVRYDGSDPNTEDHELVSGSPDTSNLGDLDRLLEWHYQAVPDQFERRRNDVIFNNYQENRNPFIDRPELVHSVFVNSFNDTQLTLEDAISLPDGGSILELDFGRVIVGSELPATKSVILNKSGLDGTYYEVVTTSDQVTSSVTGRYNAFALGATGTQQIEIGLAGSTATAGLIGGEVIIDNLDVTNSYGNGRADDDSEDSVLASLKVLDHSNASFTAGVDTNTLTLNIGQVSVCDDVSGIGREFSVFNLEAASGFTAGLDLDTISVSGDVGVFTLDQDPFNGVQTIEDTMFSGLAAGDGVSFRAIANENQNIGMYSATYTLGFSDEDLPGAEAVDPLTLILSVELVRDLCFFDGDYNGDSFVGQADLDLVLLNWGATTVPPEWVHATLFDGVEVSQNELDGVLLNWGNGYPPGVGNGFLAAVPEPNSALLFVMFAIGVHSLGRLRY